MLLLHKKTGEFLEVSEDIAKEQYLVEKTGWEIPEGSVAAKYFGGKPPELTLKEMREILKENNVKAPRNAKKATLIKLLEGLIDEAK